MIVTSQLANSGLSESGGALAERKHEQAAYEGIAAGIANKTHQLRVRKVEKDEYPSIIRKIEFWHDWAKNAPGFANKRFDYVCTSSSVKNHCIKGYGNLYVCECEEANRFALGYLVFNCNPPQGTDH